MDRDTKVLFSEIVKVFTTPPPSEAEVYEEKKFNSYPFDKARKGHNEAVEKILSSDFTFLSSPTGMGKTAIALTAICESDLPSIYIVPRNALQVDIAEKYKIPKEIMFLLGKRKMCDHYIDRDTMLCDLRVVVKGKTYIRYKGELLPYPCEDCPYLAQKKLIEQGLFENTCIPVLNQGNFFEFKNHAKFVVVDEADATFSAIKNAVSYPEQIKADNPEETLRYMLQKYNDALSRIEQQLEDHEALTDSEIIELNKERGEIERRINKIELFLKKYPDKLISYIRGGTTYVEVFEEDMKVVAQRLFPQAKKILLITATPPLNYAKEAIYFTLPFPRVRVFCDFVGNLSVRNLGKVGDDLLAKAVERIIKINSFISKLTGVRKSVIHCGNLNKHGKTVAEILENNGFKPVLMEEGNQAKVIEEFKQGDYDFLCIVAAEYGMDWKEFPLQFVLKVPFADLSDPRVIAIKSLMVRKYGLSEGQHKFHEWYDWDALSRVIQACGRNARDPQAFAVSVILDDCFERLYIRFEDKIPSWFKERLIWVRKPSAG